MYPQMPSPRESDNADIRAAFEYISGRRGGDNMPPKAQRTASGKNNIPLALKFLLRSKIFPPTSSTNTSGSNRWPQPRDAPPQFTASSASVDAAAGISRSSSAYSAYPAAPAPSGPQAALGVSDLDMSQYLRKFDTVFVVDDSGSMVPLWNEAREALSSIADLAVQYDTDGVELHFLNNPWHGEGLTTREGVDEVFKRVQPRGPTPTGRKLKEIFDHHIPRLMHMHEGRSVKPVNIVVITDGVPTIDPEDAIVEAARKLDALDLPPHILGVQFVQIGDDADAAEALLHLDDNLSRHYGIRDMVDTTPFYLSEGKLTPQTLTKILLGGVLRRVDRARNV